MKTSAAGRAAIKQREGVVLSAYKDSVNVLTIGVGHTSAAGAPTVYKGMKITAAQADEILSRDLAIFEKGVSHAVKVPLSQNEFDALVSFAFNVGVGAFQRSTLLKELNKGNRYGAANELLRWNKAGGRVLKGLTSRRKAERDQFLNSKTSGLPDPKPPTGTPPASGNWLARILAALFSLFKRR
ncbi:lysozyme [Sinorhizobium meliloti]|uniref:lysozyme n=1 Tax=Rhizobium meliloti TaxID=382 RepID=UPI000FDA3476|nr:lysozyme [Sinorhizobium meliloti]RVE97498.1 lysozyme [Sinorhizobium meliloti]